MARINLKSLFSIIIDSGGNPMLPEVFISVFFCDAKHLFILHQATRTTRNINSSRLDASSPK